MLRDCRGWAILLLCVALFLGPWLMEQLPLEHCWSQRLGGGGERSDKSHSST